MKRKIIMKRIKFVLELAVISITSCGAIGAPNMNINQNTLKKGVIVFYSGRDNN